MGWTALVVSGVLETVWAAALSLYEDGAGGKGFV